MSNFMSVENFFAHINLKYNIRFVWLAVLVANILPRAKSYEAKPRSRTAGQGGNSGATGEFYLDATPGDIKSDSDSRAAHQRDCATSF